ncbi:unnamed protein product [Amoebophrya sp. A25]|nr:unnamed protein product [Amoebophrya sp. A25]|eukprot:GSA25T00006277001.1
MSKNKMTLLLQTPSRKSRSRDRPRRTPSRSIFNICSTSFGRIVLVVSSLACATILGYGLAAAKGAAREAGYSHNRFESKSTSSKSKSKEKSRNYINKIKAAGPDAVSSGNAKDQSRAGLQAGTTSSEAPDPDLIKSSHSSGRVDATSTTTRDHHHEMAKSQTSSPTLPSSKGQSSHSSGGVGATLAPTLQQWSHPDTEEANAEQVHQDQSNMVEDQSMARIFAEDTVRILHKNKTMTMTFERPVGFKGIHNDVDTPDSLGPAFLNESLGAADPGPSDLLEDLPRVISLEAASSAVPMRVELESLATRAVGVQPIRLPSSRPPSRTGRVAGGVAAEPPSASKMSPLLLAQNGQDADNAAAVALSLPITALQHLSSTRGDGDKKSRRALLDYQLDDDSDENRLASRTELHRYLTNIFQPQGSLNPCLSNWALQQLQGEFLIRVAQSLDDCYSAQQELDASSSSLSLSDLIHRTIVDVSHELVHALQLFEEEDNYEQSAHGAPAALSSSGLADFYVYDEEMNRCINSIAEERQESTGAASSTAGTDGTALASTSSSTNKNSTGSYLFISSNMEGSTSSSSYSDHTPETAMTHLKVPLVREEEVVAHDPTAKHGVKMIKAKNQMPDEDGPLSDAERNQTKTAQEMTQTRKQRKSLFRFLWQTIAVRGFAFTRRMTVDAVTDALEWAVQPHLSFFVENSVSGPLLDWLLRNELIEMDARIPPNMLPNSDGEQEEPSPRSASSETNVVSELIFSAGSVQHVDLLHANDPYYTYSNNFLRGKQNENFHLTASSRRRGAASSSTAPLPSCATPQDNWYHENANMQLHSDILQAFSACPSTQHPSALLMNALKENLGLTQHQQGQQRQDPMPQQRLSSSKSVDTLSPIARALLQHQEEPLSSTNSIFMPTLPAAAAALVRQQVSSASYNTNRIPTSPAGATPKHLLQVPVQQISSSDEDTTSTPYPVLQQISSTYVVLPGIFVPGSYLASPGVAVAPNPYSSATSRHDHGLQHDHDLQEDSEWTIEDNALFTGVGRKARTSAAQAQGGRNYKNFKNPLHSRPTRTTQQLQAQHENAKKSRGEITGRRGTSTTAGRPRVLPEEHQNSSTTPAEVVVEHRTRNVPVRDCMTRTQLCRYFEKGKCDRADTCKFAHGLEQLAPRPNYNKTALCKNFEATGICVAGDKCTFAHGLAELRRRVHQHHVVDSLLTDSMGVVSHSRDSRDHVEDRTDSMGGVSTRDNTLTQSNALLRRPHDRNRASTSQRPTSLSLQRLVPATPDGQVLENLEQQNPGVASSSRAGHVASDEPRGRIQAQRSKQMRA